ncbi:MAG: helix-turn-helix domain-containing protein [Acetobacteraceae bacterium]|nr:helix-turn-helix domain-containing protein [Acetobacteraceae bacterium]
MQVIAPMGQRHGDTRAEGAAIRVPSEDAIDLLEQFGITVKVERGHEIHAQGHCAEHCWRIVSGCVRTVKLLEDGRRAVGEFLFAGDYFGQDDVETYDLAAEAVTDVVLRRYPRRMVEALADSHAVLARRLRGIALSNLRAAHERAAMLGRKTASERLASFLLEMDRRCRERSGSFLELPMSRGDIADYLGLTVETVCRLLSQFRREGAIAVGRTGVELCSRAMLRSAA